MASIFPSSAYLRSVLGCSPNLSTATLNGTYLLIVSKVYHKLAIVGKYGSACYPFRFNSLDTPRTTTTDVMMMRNLAKLPIVLLVDVYIVTPLGLGF